MTKVFGPSLILLGYSPWLGRGDQAVRSNIGHDTLKRISLPKCLRQLRFKRISKLERNTKRSTLYMVIFGTENFLDTVRL
jgi:hypothetical protein